MDNIIRAVFCGSRYTTTKSAWLIDHGMVLKLSGVELPEVYEVDFSNSKTSAAKRVLGNADGVVIPDEYFLSKAQQIYAWVYLTTGDSGFTTLQVTIPLTQRPDVTDEPPTPQETDLIEQAIAALNTGVTRAETAADDAEQSAAEAKEAAENIQQAVEDALQEAKESGEFDGKDGANGVTYTPTVDAEGVISWVNDGDLPNPQPRDIRGPQGEKLTYNDLTPADKADLVQGPIAEAQTAAVAAVNQAGAAQAEAVQQKGAEVLESIPADYTELAEDVSDLKSQISAFPLMANPFMFEKTGTSPLNNARAFKITKNRLSIKGYGNSSTYRGVFVTGYGGVRNVTGTYGTFMSLVQDEDFVTLADMNPNARLILEITFDKRLLSGAGSPGSGVVTILTKDGEGTVSGKEFNVGALPSTIVINKFFPAVITNKNMAIGLRSYNVDANTDITMDFALKIIIPLVYTDTTALALALENN